MINFGVRKLNICLTQIVSFSQNMRITRFGWAQGLSACFIKNGVMQLMVAPRNS